MCLLGESDGSLLYEGGVIAEGRCVWCAFFGWSLGIGLQWFFFCCYCYYSHGIELMR